MLGDAEAQQTDRRLAALEMGIRAMLRLPPDHRVSMMELVRGSRACWGTGCECDWRMILYNSLKCRCRADRLPNI